MRLNRARYVPALVWGIALVILWEVTSLLLDIGKVTLAQSKLPYIHEVVATMFIYGSTIVTEGWATFTNAGIGFLLGAAVGVILAILMSISTWIERISFPYVIVSQMIPVLGLAPIIYGIVRDDEWSRVLIAAYITFFPVSLNMLKGLRSVNGSSRELMYSYAAKPWMVYWKLLLPNALPGLFGGLKIAAPLSVTAAILVELMGAQHGIGVIMLRNLYYGPSNAYMFWATVFASALLGIANYVIVMLIERITTPWQPAFRVKGGKP